MSSNEQIVNEEFQNLFKVNKGIWAFIFIDFFIFVGLLAYHYSIGLNYVKEYSFAKSQMLLSFGFFNTIILLTSGLTIGLSKAAASQKNHFLSMAFVFITFILSMLFVANRAIDCTYLAGKGFLFGTDAFTELNTGLSHFFTTYFFAYFLFMGHLLVGITLLTMVMINYVKEREVGKQLAKLNFTVIYWSYLTMVWAFIFPVLFLI